MKVAIVETKVNTNAIAVLRAFKKGIENQNDEPIYIKNKRETSRLESVDIAIQVGKETKWDPTSLRWKVYEWATENQKRRIIIEPGVFGFCNNRLDDNNLRDRYFQLCLNDIKRDGIWLIDTPDDRWTALESKFDVNVKPFKVEPEKPILILGQNERGTSVQNFDILRYHQYLIQIIPEFYSKNKIIYVPHPNQSKLPSNVEFCKIEECRSNEELDRCILNSFFCCSYTTNASVGVILNGRPLFTPCPSNLAFPLRSKSMLMEDFEKNYSHERKQWLADLAYTSYSLEEIDKGIPWKLLKSCIG